MRLYHISILCTALAFVACQENDELTTHGGEETLELVTPTVTDTRTVLQPNGTSVAWTNGDAIAVYDYSAPKHEFTAEVTNESTRFRGNITARQSSFIAVYPYGLASENMVNQKVILTLPQEQTAVAGSFGLNLNPSIAKGERNLDGSPSQIRFRNICQLFKLSVPEYAKDRIARIEFTANTSICGQMEIDYSQYNPAVSISQQGNKTITLLPPTGSSAFAEGTYYMVLAPTAVEGFTLTFTDTQNKVYTQHSSTTIGGTPAFVYNLGNIDMVDVPVITPQHAYVDDVLHGTNLTLTAPVPDKEWTAVVKNASGTVVRTVTATGTLTSGYANQEWPYLPKGNYTVEYSYTTANGKTMNATTTFQITEDPKFSFTFNAASSYTYYKGDGVTRDVAKANSMSASQVTGIVCNAAGILPEILADSRYGFNLTTNFHGTIAASSYNQATFNDITLSTLGENTLTATLTFDGVDKTASKKVYITGLPFRHIPPTAEMWEEDNNVTTFNADHVRIGGERNFTGEAYIQNNKISIPSGTKMRIDYKVDIYMDNAANTQKHQIIVGNKTVFNFSKNGYTGTKEYDESSTFTNDSKAEFIRCYTGYTYGNAHSKTYKIALSYAE